MICRLLSSLLLGVSAIAAAQQSILPLATSVLESKAGSQLSISGSGFGNGLPAVTLAGTPLAVQSASDTLIVAALPANTPPGDYLLTIVNARTRLPGIFTATIAPKQGAVGPAGPGGLQGSAGPTGPRGPSGAQGPAGPSGVAGATGSTGAAGLAGAAGVQGAVGAAGPAAPAGAPGPGGAQGPAGAAGIAGARGPVGVQGAVGAVGPAGPAGPPGAQGSQGVAGQTGAAGLPGAPGPAGVTGPSGSGAPGTFFSANLLLRDYASAFGTPLGVGVVQDDSSGVPSSNLLSSQLCSDPIKFQATAYGAQGTSTLNVQLLTFQKYDFSLYALYASSPSCTLRANNGAPVSCALSTVQQRPSDGFFDGPSIIYLGFSDPDGWNGARLMVSAVCQ